MGKKLKGLAVTAIAAGAYAYFKDPANREKAQQFVQDTKEKVESFIEQKKTEYTNGSEVEQTSSHHEDLEKKAGNPDPYDTADNEMVSEGAQTSVQYYGQEVEDDADANADGLYHKHLKEES
ncbi:hypothetical protein [Savagea faecisuis]|uniref:YtxH domain-containing protein n=1 Tax=Savagea faecisuis TaxID=1274803 RepID=A0ABW3H3S7_9BACL